MAKRLPLLVLVVVLLGLAGCGGSSEDPPGDGGGTLPLLAAGPQLLAPASEGAWAEGVDLGRLGLSSVAAFYDLTTPASEPFAFDLLCRRAGNAGRVRVSVAHAVDGASTPSGGPETLAAAGFIATGAGRQRHGAWLDVVGDGFSRLTLRGHVERDHILAVQAEAGGGAAAALVRVRIGARGPINVAAETGADYPGVLEETTLYSSDAWVFGLPTIATSGDRTSVVCYEGDRGNEDAWGRFEMRLQYDAATLAITGGGSEESSPDSGNWRDHEIAALYNVLVLVHGGDDQVTCKLSFDRGATFAQIEQFEHGVEGWRPRLVQLAMALDYSLAVLYWRSNRDGSSDLVLVEGTPSAFDTTGSPTAFSFVPPAVIHHTTGDVTPALFSAAWSEGGDLVVGYAFTRFTSRPDRTWESLTQNRCAVRPWGGVFGDVLVEEDRVVGRDPSVALLGSGEELSVYYAYDAMDGVRLRVSHDAGRTFSEATGTVEVGAHMPTVFARPSETVGETTVDLLYLAFGEAGGMELHLLHWPSFSVDAVGEAWRLTEASVDGELVPPGPLPPMDAMPGGYGLVVTQVAWLGYDALLDEGEIVVVYDEETVDSFLFYGAPEVFLDFGAPGGVGAAPADEFLPVDPPPLADGMTEDVPAPDPTHRHQLKLLRLR